MKASLDADQPPVSLETGAVSWRCLSSDLSVAFPAGSPPILLLNRLMRCPKPVQQKDGRQPYTGEENVTVGAFWATRSTNASPHCEALLEEKCREFSLWMPSTVH